MEKLTYSSNINGAFCSMAAMVCFSINDVSFKLLSGIYPLHEIVLIRSVIAMAFFLIFIMPFAGGWSCVKTGQLSMNLLRGICVVFANTFFLWD